VSMASRAVELVRFRRAAKLEGRNGQRRSQVLSSAGAAVKSSREVQKGAAVQAPEKALHAMPGASHRIVSRRILALDETRPPANVSILAQ
jgi:hypothetical protein